MGFNLRVQLFISLTLLVTFFSKPALAVNYCGYGYASVYVLDQVKLAENQEISQLNYCVSINNGAKTLTSGAEEITYSFAPMIPGIPGTPVCGTLYDSKDCRVADPNATDPLPADPKITPSASGSASPSPSGHPAGSPYPCPGGGGPSALPSASPAAAPSPESGTYSKSAGLMPAVQNPIGLHITDPNQIPSHTSSSKTAAFMPALATGSQLYSCTTSSATGTALTEREAAAAAVGNHVYSCIRDFYNKFYGYVLYRIQLPPKTVLNIQNAYRPDLQGLTRVGHPFIQMYETDLPTFEAVFQQSNSMTVSFRTMAAYNGDDSLPPRSLGDDCGATAGDYAGLLASMMTTSNKGFPNVAITSWQTNMLLAWNNGLSAWTAYWLSHDPEVYKYAGFVIREATNTPCGGSDIACNRGVKLNNVMMADETDNSRDRVFPPRSPSYIQNAFPSDWDAAGDWAAAIFYDISVEYGLGDTKTNMLLWKAISLIDNSDNFTIRDMGSKILQAARLLWPSTINPGQSIYEAGLMELLRSRGIAIGSESDFRQNITPPLLTTTKMVSTGFGSSVPDTMPSIDAAPGTASYFENSYVQPDAGPNDYMVYQFLKYSKYAPCQKLMITDGTFTDTGSGISYNYDGNYYDEATGDLSNMLLIAKGNRIDWVRYKALCDYESIAPWYEQMRPFGFRVIGAYKNGFAMKATRLNNYYGSILYQLSIVDPSLSTLGAASYTFTITDPYGRVVPLSYPNATASTGANVTYWALRDQPLTIQITRVRAGQPDVTITMNEPSSYLDDPNRTHYLDHHAQ